MHSAWFGETRSIEEQLCGLAPALAEAKDSTVYDFGCAEGLIALKFLEAGARLVDGFDNNARYLQKARALRKALPAAERERMQFHYRDLDQLQSPAPLAGRDIVLALAILHKLRDPEARAREMAELAGTLLVVRLPLGSDGRIRHKHGPAGCDLRDVLPSCGLTLETTIPGPRGELVQYWRRIS